MHTITKRRLRLAIFAIWKQQVLYILKVSVQHTIPCVTLYCHLWSVCLYCTLPHYLIKDMIFGGKKLLNTKCVLIFSTTVIRNISHSKKNLDIIINVHASSKYLLFLSDVKEAWIILADFRKIFKFKFSWMSCSVNWAVPCRWADRHNKTNTRFSNFVNVPKNRQSVCDEQFMTFYWQLPYLSVFLMSHLFHTKIKISFTFLLSLIDILWRKELKCLLAKVVVEYVCCS